MQTDNEKKPDAAKRLLETMIREHPALEAPIRAFGRVRAAVDAGVRRLEPPNVASFTPDLDLLRKGVPLLEQAVPFRIEPHFERVRAVMLPAMAEAFPALAGEIEGLRAKFEDETFCAEAERVFLEDDPEGLEGLARTLNMDAGVFGFLCGLMAGPALESASQALGPLLRDVSWTVWNRGVCPVCGGRPSMSMLEYGEQEPTEFLRNMSGRRRLCCSDCSHTWRFSRTLCPACGRDGQDGREYFHVAGRAMERVEVCKECGHYLLTLDVRERLSVPDHRLAPLGLIHLDMLAREKGYAPQVETPWNQASSRCA